MVLAIDVGNTNIVIGGFNGDELSFVSRIQSDRRKMPDEFGIALNSVLHFHGVKVTEITGAIISSVVPSITGMLQKAIKALCGFAPMIVSSGIKTGLNIRIDDPAELGADLVCGAVRALHKYKLPCIIVDLGTATKFSILDEKGSFIGGSILPGVTISLEALSKNAAMLPNIDLAASAPPVIGTNTTDCMRSGMIHGVASMIDGMIERLKKEMGSDVTVVATGGVAGNIIPFCTSEIVYDEDLVLMGIKEIYERNKK